MFAAIVRRRLSGAEFGDSNSTAAFIGLLGLPVTMVGTAMVHYIAHFQGQNDHSRLQGLFAGAQRFFLLITIGGSLLALVLADPLGHLFNFRSTLVLAAAVTTLVGLWTGLATAMCQGMGWFKRLAIINFIVVLLRLGFGWIATATHPTAEMAVYATTFSSLATLALLYWRKAIFQRDAKPISPWNREFVQFLLVTATYVGGNWFFLNGDQMVAKKFFSGDDLGAYQVAARFTTALPGTVLPLLLVVFTSRSGKKHQAAKDDQLILLGLYATGIACGAAILIALRHTLIEKICGKPDPRAEAILVPYTVTMALVGLGQAIGMWSLASRWFKVTALYGALGLVYWALLFMMGKTVETLLHLMPIAAGTAFLLLLAWWSATRVQTKSQNLTLPD